MHSPSFAYLLEGVVNGVTALSSAIYSSSSWILGGFDIRWSEELLKQDIHAPRHLGHEEKLSHAVQGALLIPGPLHTLACSEVGGRRAMRRRVASLLDKTNDAGRSSGARSELSSRNHGGVGHCGLSLLKTRGGRSRWTPREVGGEERFN